MDLFIEVISDMFVNGAPSLKFVGLCGFAFLWVWLAIFLLALISCSALTSDADERKLAADAFSNEGNNVFFFGTLYTLVLLLWHFNIFSKACRVFIWTITIMCIIDLVMFFVKIVIYSWRSRGNRYYYSSVSEKIKDIIGVILHSLTEILACGVFVFITFLITLSN